MPGDWRLKLVRVQDKIKYHVGSNLFSPSTAFVRNTFKQYLSPKGGSTDIFVVECSSIIICNQTSQN